MAKTQKSSAPAAATKLSEALRLSLTEGLSIRAISRRLQVTRKTVRKLLGRAPVRQLALTALPRGSLLDTYDVAIRQLVADTPELTAPAVMERLRPLGYTGGISILRDRLTVTSSRRACATRFCQVSAVTRDFTRIRSELVGSSTKTIDHAQISPVNRERRSGIVSVTTGLDGDHLHRDHRGPWGPPVCVLAQKWPTAERSTMMARTEKSEGPSH